MRRPTWFHMNIMSDKHINYITFVQDWMLGISSLYKIGQHNGEYIIDCLIEINWNQTGLLVSDYHAILSTMLISKAMDYMQFPSFVYFNYTLMIMKSNYS